MTYPMANMPLDLLIKYFERSNIIFICNGDGKTVTEEVE